MSYTKQYLKKEILRVCAKKSTKQHLKQLFGSNLLIDFETNLTDDYISNLKVDAYFQTYQDATIDVGFIEDIFCMVLVGETDWQVYLKKYGDGDVD